VLLQAAVYLFSKVNSFQTVCERC